MLFNGHTKIRWQGSSRFCSIVALQPKLRQTKKRPSRDFKWASSKHERFGIRRKLLLHKELQWIRQHESIRLR